MCTKNMYMKKKKRKILQRICMVKVWFKSPRKYPTMKLRWWGGKYATSFCNYPDVSSLEISNMDSKCKAVMFLKKKMILNLHKFICFERKRNAHELCLQTNNYFSFSMSVAESPPLKITPIAELATEFVMEFSRAGGSKTKCFKMSDNEIIPATCWFLSTTIRRCTSAFTIVSITSDKVSSTLHVRTPSNHWKHWISINFMKMKDLRLIDVWVLRRQSHPSRYKIFQHTNW